MSQGIELIAAVSRNGVIGLDGALPWNIPAELAHFRELTYGHIVVMGRRTWESLPESVRPLPGRLNVVVTRNPPIDTQNTIYIEIHRLEERIGGLKAAHPDKRIFICGGAQLYSYFLKHHWSQRPAALHITHVDKVIQGCDSSLTYFPYFHNIDKKAYIISEIGPKLWSAEESCAYQYITYKMEKKRWIKYDNDDIPHYDLTKYAYSADHIYADLIRDILSNGHRRPDRTGTGTISVFGRQLSFGLDGRIPLLTTKYVPWKSVIKELLWFLKGQTDASILKTQGVGIWDGNTSREFLDGRGLGHLPPGDIGAGYGFQWRHFGGAYKTCKDTYDNTIGVDQVASVLDQLRTDPFSRRIYMTAWNPAALESMALPPCHVSAQFYVDVDEDGVKHLSCHMYQRSVDVFLGLPFNIMSYAVLTYIFATMCDMKPRELVISTGDTHIYADHVEQVKMQLCREPYMEPLLLVDPVVAGKTVDELDIDDFDVVGYFHHGVLKGKMAV